MNIRFDDWLDLEEFDRTALRDRFVKLIEAGELHEGRAYEYVLDHKDKIYILAPDWVRYDESGQWRLTGYILMREAEWHV